MKKLLFVLLICAFTASTQAQTIKPAKGYSNDIGNVVAMLEDLKQRVTNSVQNLNQAETDFLLDEQANRIGAMVLHLAATEKYYQVFTFEGRGYNKAEKEEWGDAMNLGEAGRDNLVNQPISYYLEKWDEVRKETLRLLKTKDDKWFKKKVGDTSMNNHWAWYHVMEHQANHMGQIRLLAKRAKD